MTGNGSLEVQLPERYIIANVYNVRLGYTLTILVNGVKMYNLPSAFTGSLPLGNLHTGGVPNTVIVQWFSSGAIPTFLRLLFTTKQLSQEAG
jgi:hypothetical protein